MNKPNRLTHKQHTECALHFAAHKDTLENATPEEAQLELLEQCVIKCTRQQVIEIAKVAGLELKYRKISNSNKSDRTRALAGELVKFMSAVGYEQKDVTKAIAAGRFCDVRKVENDE